MDEETTGFWMVALGAATASGTWEGFRISPLRHTASLHVDGALTIKDDRPGSRDYALVLSHPSVDRDRILVAGRGGTVEFGHDLVDSLARERPGISPTLWLADLSTGECSERCELPRAPRALPPAARPADEPAADLSAVSVSASAPDLSAVSVSASAADLSVDSAAVPAAVPTTAPVVVLAAGPSTDPSVPDPPIRQRVDGHADTAEIH